MGYRIGVRVTGHKAKVSCLFIMFQSAHSDILTLAKNMGFIKTFEHHFINA